MRPLPADLQAGAAVFRYDEQTGERIVLRTGSNHVECHPRDATGFTRCFSVTDGPRRDFIARMSAQGMAGDELQAAVDEAITSGSIKPREFGSISHRLYDKDDRIQLLWIVYLPNATSDVMCMSTASQRDNALDDAGRDAGCAPDDCHQWYRVVQSAELKASVSMNTKKPGKARLFLLCCADQRLTAQTTFFMAVM